jgi:hypothetical protein
VEPIQSHLGGRTQGLARGMGRWLTLSLIAAVVMMAGCGGSSSSGGTSASTAAATSAAATTSATTPTSTQAAPSSPMAAAESICGEFNERLVVENKTLKGFKAVPGALAHRALTEQAALSELTKLKPPAKIARTWAQIIAYRRTLERNLVELVQKARHNDFNSMNAVYAATATVERELLAVGQRAGFEHCAHVG